MNEGLGSVGDVGVDGTHEEVRGVSLWPFATAIARYVYIVLGLPLVFATWAGVRALQAPRQYEASAAFAPQQGSPAQAGLGQLASQFGIALPAGNTVSPQFYADLLQSREVLRQAVVSTYHVTWPTVFDGGLVKYFRIDLPSRDDAVAAAVESLKGSVIVRTDRNTGVVHFTVQTAYPALSEQLAERLLELVNDFNLQRRQTQGRAEREFVEQRLAVAQRDLADSEEALLRFLRGNRWVADSPELVAEQARLQRVVTLRQQIYIGLAQSLEAAKIEEVRNTSVITIIERPEGFVALKARRVVDRVILALFLGGLLGVGLSLGLDFLLRASRERSPGYAEFAAEARSTMARASRLFAGRTRG